MDAAVCGVMPQCDVMGLQAHGKQPSTHTYQLPLCSIHCMLCTRTHSCTTTTSYPPTHTLALHASPPPHTPPHTLTHHAPDPASAPPPHTPIHSLHPPPHTPIHSPHAPPPPPRIVMLRPALLFCSATWQRVWAAGLVLRGWFCGEPGMVLRGRYCGEPGMVLRGRYCEEPGMVLWGWYW